MATPKLPPLIAEHREELLAIAERLNLANLRLFGSMARGDWDDDSDVDLMVDLRPDTRGLALGGLVVDAERLLGRKVDVVTTASLRPGIRERVLRDAVAL